MMNGKLNDITTTIIPSHQYQHQQLQKPNKMQITPQHIKQLLQQQPQDPIMPSQNSAQTTGASAYITTPLTYVNSIPSSVTSSSIESKYSQMLDVIEEIGSDIGPTYSGSRNTLRIKRNIAQAHFLVHECLTETKRYCSEIEKDYVVR